MKRIFWAILAIIPFVFTCPVEAKHGGWFERVSAVEEPSQGFASGSAYQICFVPDGMRCEDLLVNAINSEPRWIRVQAYSFTSAPIAEALRNAKGRGVDVEVILDKSQKTERYTSATFIAHAGIPVYIDTKPAIAHNKVMIFGSNAVFTGSFNFTRSAQDRNAENGMLIRGDTNISRAYLKNWETRKQVSIPYQ